MAINKNHEFEELNGVKCGIVEKNLKPDRAAFLKDILEFNGFTVEMVLSPPPKVAPAPKPSEGEIVETVPEPPATPETFTLGVTDYTFNPINAIFGRLLKTKDGHIITLAYWNQETKVNNDEVPYYES